MKIKESISNDPKQFIPVLTEVLITATSGNTSEEWKSIKDPKTDDGKRSHLATRGTGNVVITAMAGAAFVKELPEIAEKLSEKIKKVANTAEIVLVKRTSWLNNLKLQYGPFNISNFKPQGLLASDVPNATYTEMLEEYSNVIDNATKKEYLNELIKTGSSVPLKKSFEVGDELYKIVPKGENVTPFTPFFMTKIEYESLKNFADIEQKLGLPLVSHSVEYDVFKITANQKAKAFESTIANTIEKTYKTIGGAKQILIIDRSKWNTPLKIKTIIPNK